MPWVRKENKVLVTTFKIQITFKNFIKRFLMKNWPTAVKTLKITGFFSLLKVKPVKLNWFK